MSLTNKHFVKAFFSPFRTLCVQKTHTVHEIKVKENHIYFHREHFFPTNFMLVNNRVFLNRSFVFRNFMDFFLDILRDYQNGSFEF